MSNTSHQLFEKAKAVIPGGVNSPVRSFNGIGDIEPPFIDRAFAATIVDVEGKEYVDYVGSWGPMVLGHAHPKVLQAVQETAQKGLSFGAPCQLEIDLAQLICDRIKSIDQIRMVNSGTEATMTAIRLARGYTKRNLLIKFEGCYHGHSDSLLIKAGSGLLTFGNPSSAGVPQELANYTLNLPYNNVQAVANAFEKYGDQIAAVILEPIAGNMNCIPAKAEFLQSLRSHCSEHDSVLIFDEVMTGFRVHAESAQGLYNITPDLTTFGKIIGGGMPVGALGGSEEIMSYLAPLGPVYQAGTLSGNPLAMAAGLSTLTEIFNTPNFYQQLEEKTSYLAHQLSEIAHSHDIPLLTQHVTGMFGIFFTEATAITSFEEVMTCDQEKFKQFFKGMLHAGVYLAPSAFEAGFVSIAHSEKEIKFTLDAAQSVFKAMQS